MKRSPAAARYRRGWRLALLAVCAIGLYAIIPQRANFHGSLSVLRHANYAWVALAITAVLSTFITAAAVYKLLAFQVLPFGEIVLVQLAAMFVNRLLPAGTGAIATNVAYLRHRRHSLTQATTVTAINNLCGIMAHLSILLLVCIMLLNFARTPALPMIHIHVLSVLGTVLGLVIVIAFVLRFAAVRRFGGRVVYHAQRYRQRPVAIGGALLFSAALTIGNVCALWCCAHAVGLHLSVLPAFLALTLGVGAGTAIPTPGALGGMEAGLYAGLVWQHQPSAPALAAVLLFRLLSFWLPLGFGAAAFAYLQNRHTLWK